MTHPAEPITCPFTILVDSAESQPFTFHDMKADSKGKYAPIAVRTKWQSLSRYPHSTGDYSIEGYAGRVGVERKSLEDCQGTVLGWESQHERENQQAGRRERFEKELENLSTIEAAIVIVEASMHDCLLHMPQWGKKSQRLNRKIFFRSVLAYMQDYRVPWLFCDGRRTAEVACFRFLWRWWEKQHL